MIIEWNKVTWYSKLGALILFIIIVPVITFIIGKEYQKTVNVLENGGTSYHNAMSEKKRGATGKTPMPIVTSGITGTVTMDSVCPKNDNPRNVCKTPSLVTPLIVKNAKGKTVTHTVSRSDGKFFLLLPPDTYKIGVASAESFKGSSVMSVTVEAEKIVPAKLSL